MIKGLTAADQFTVDVWFELLIKSGKYPTSLIQFAGILMDITDSLSVTVIEMTGEPIINTFVDIPTCPFWSILLLNRSLDFR